MAVLAPICGGTTPWRARKREPITGGLGRSPPAGSRAKPLVRGRSPPEDEALMVFGRLMEAANLPACLKFGSAKKSDICVIFAKKSGVATKLGGWSKTWGGRVVLPRPEPKTATEYDCKH